MRSLWFTGVRPQVHVRRARPPIGRRCSEWLLRRAALSEGWLVAISASRVGCSYRRKEVQTPISA